MKKIVCSVAVLLAMTTQPLLANAEWQWPSLGTPFFKVDEQNQNVSVYSYKEPGFPYSTDSVFSIFNNGTERVKVTPNGGTVWTLHSYTGESGQLSVSTPGGGVGIISLVPNLDGTQTRFNIGTWPTDVNGTHVFDVPTSALGFSGTPPNNGGIYITMPNNYVGINTAAPQARFEVKDGGIRINNTLDPSQRPACDATTRGLFWVTTGTDTDSVSVCLYKKSRTPAYRWRTVVSTGDDEHVTGNSNHIDAD